MLLINLRTYNYVILKRSFHIAKQSYFEIRFNQFKFDIKNTWKTMNEILSKSKTNKSFPTYFKESNSIMTDKLEIANKFNAFFTNIGNHLASSRDHSYYLNKKVNSVFTLNKIEEYTVKRIINNLPNKNSYGFDGFPPNY